MTPEGRVRVVVGQLRASVDRAANLVVARDVVASAEAVGADLVVLPEYASAFDPLGVGPQHAEDVAGPFVTGLRDAACQARTTVLAGVTLPGPGPDHERARNVIMALGPDGELIGSYVKVHLYDAFGQRESDRLIAGPADAAPLVIPVGPLHVGVLTCYDLRFPESSRRLIDAGADMLVIPAAWAAGPLKADHWRTLVCARAIENTAVVLAVGQAGRGVVGRSMLVGPDGRVALELGKAPETRVVEVDVAALHAVRRSNPSLDNRRYRVVPR